MPRGCFGDDKAGPGRGYCVDRLQSAPSGPCSYSISPYREAAHRGQGTASSFDRGDCSCVGLLNASSARHGDHIDGGHGTRSTQGLPSTTALVKPSAKLSELARARLDHLRREAEHRDDLRDHGLRLDDAIAALDALHGEGRDGGGAGHGQRECRDSAVVEAGIKGCIDALRDGGGLGGCVNDAADGVRDALGACQRAIEQGEARDGVHSDFVD